MTSQLSSRQSTRRVSFKRSLLKKLTVNRGLCPSTLMESCVEGKLCNREWCMSNWVTGTFRRIVKQSHATPQGRFTRCGLQPTSGFRSQDVGYNCITHLRPFLNLKQHPKHRTWTEEKKDKAVVPWSKNNFLIEDCFAFHSEIQVFTCLS